MWDINGLVAPLVVTQLRGRRHHVQSVGGDDRVPSARAVNTLRKQHCGGTQWSSPTGIAAAKRGVDLSVIKLWSPRIHVSSSPFQIFLRWMALLFYWPMLRNSQTRHEDWWIHIITKGLNDLCYSLCWVTLLTLVQKAGVWFQVIPVWALRQSP